MRARKRPRVLGHIPKRVVIPSLGGMAKRSAAMVLAEFETMPAPSAWACHTGLDSSSAL
jgi:hypothetical protein